MQIYCDDFCIQIKIEKVGNILCRQVSNLSEISLWRKAIKANLYKAMLNSLLTMFDILTKLCSFKLPRSHHICLKKKKKVSWYIYHLALCLGFTKCHSLQSHRIKGLEMQWKVCFFKLSIIINYTVSVLPLTVMTISLFT